MQNRLPDKRKSVWLWQLRWLKPAAFCPHYANVGTCSITLRQALACRAPASLLNMSQKLL
jgi:hypothetical protein